MREFFAFARENLMYVAMFSLVLVVSVGVSLSKPEVVEWIFPRKTADISLLPMFVGEDDFPVLSAQGVVAVDMDSAVVLYEKDADRELLPASTTKIMTALVAKEYYDLDEVVKVDNAGVVGQKMGLRMGEEISFKNILYGLLVYSANDAAEVVAHNYPGGRDTFVATMNLKADELGLVNTVFKNPTGLDGLTHRSTARDMVRLAEIALRDPLISKIVQTENVVVKSTDGKIVHKLHNTNELLGKTEGVLGVKTGWTEAARENLVTYVERDNKKVLIALLGSQDRFGETEELIEWIYRNYGWNDVSFYSP